MRPIIPTDTKALFKTPCAPEQCRFGLCSSLAKAKTFPFAADYAGVVDQNADLAEFL